MLTQFRPTVRGKFMSVEGRRFLVKGVTYGTFAPDSDGRQFPALDQVSADFAMMARHGINTVRTYTLPPASLLDDAARHGLHIMAGVPWSQHVAFLDDRRLRRQIRQEVTTRVRGIADHPALLLVALGNEIPASVVRWHGRSRVERFIEDLYDDAKSAAPDNLFTYVNYPPTEYLDLPFVDVVAFNVYLHHEKDLRAYMARLQLLAGGKPLLLAELGADSIRQGEDGQAVLTSMQLGTAFREGACGAIAFAWTDEWWRGGFRVDDWAFGLVDADRTAKPALDAVTQVFADAPFPPDERQHWPKVSVVVCAYNAADTIDECLTSLDQLNYPDYEVVVVNDGSSDGTGDIARRHSRARVIDTANGGLSAARNIGLQHSTGNIVAYTDADVRVDEDWLTYLVQPFLTSDAVGSGGPNVAPPDDPWGAQCIARAPGAPTHVLLDNRIAEHVPGCNMAFQREVLLEVGGFNPIYRRAGDDVDLCWRIQARGWKIGFASSALVWHHHRASIGAYWRQQVGYGEGEQWLLPHHPDRFQDGHPAWRGHIYSSLPFVRALSRARVNTGPWGMASFPSVYLRDAYPFAFMPHRVRWLAASLFLLSAGTMVDLIRPDTLGRLLLACGWLGLMTTVLRCLLFAFQSDISSLPRIGWLPRGASFAVYRSTIGLLHFVQPFARAYGRVRGMLADVELPTTERARDDTVRPSSREAVRALRTVFGRKPEQLFWGQSGTHAQALLCDIRDRLQASRAIRALDIDDGWQAGRDISVEIGRWTWLDLRVLVEDHGSNKRLARLATRLRFAPLGVVIVLAMMATMALSVSAAVTRPGLSLAYAVLVTVVLAAARWVWRTAGTLAATGQCAIEAAAACGLHPMVPAGEVVPAGGLAGAPAKKVLP